MRVIWQLSGENSKKQTGVKGPRQKIAKKPMAEVASAAKKLGKAEELGGVGGIGEPVPAA